MSGLGDYFDIDPVILRIILVVAVLVVHFLSGILIIGYIVAMIILPYKPTDLPENTEGGAKEISPNLESRNRQTFLAWAFIIIGGVSLFLVVVPAGFFQLINHNFWPILLVLVGILILISSLQKK